MAINKYGFPQGYETPAKTQDIQNALDKFTTK